MSGLPPDLEALAVRIFGEEPVAERKRALELARAFEEQERALGLARAFEEPEPPSLADRLERLTVALAALRERLRPDATPFEERMEQFARGAGKPVRFPLRGDLEDEAPGVLLDPRLWIHVHAARFAAVHGDKRAARSLKTFLEAFAVAPRRVQKAKRADAATLRAATQSQAKHFRDHPNLAETIPEVRAAVAVAKGRRGPLSWETVVRLWRHPKGRAKLQRLLSLEARDAVEAADALRRELRANAKAEGGKLKRARKAGKTRVAK